MMNWKEVEKRVTSHPGIQGGRPCLRNTRTPVYAILEALATGMSFEEVKKEFALSEDDIRACIYYATVLSNEEEIFRQSA